MGELNFKIKDTTSFPVVNSLFYPSIENGEYSCAQKSKLGWKVYFVVIKSHFGICKLYVMKTFPIGIQHLSEIGKFFFGVKPLSNIREFPLGNKNQYCLYRKYPFWNTNVIWHVKMHLLRVN